jgi:hypothetical protein
LASRIGTAMDEDLAQAEKDVRHVLLFHCHSATSVKIAAPDHTDEVHEDAVTDPLIPPVACAMLSAGVPVKEANSTIMPTFMPLLALTDTERLRPSPCINNFTCCMLPFTATSAAFGLLWVDRNDSIELRKTATHNGRNLKATGRNLEAHGVVPQSRLISHLAGECNGTFMIRRDGCYRACFWFKARCATTRKHSWSCSNGQAIMKQPPRTIRPDELSATLYIFLFAG